MNGEAGITASDAAPNGSRGLVPFHGADPACELHHVAEPMDVCEKVPVP